MQREESQADRRHFIKVAGAVSALGALHAPRVFAQAGSDHVLQLALVGAGGRGTGAAVDALTNAGYPIKLVAMADVFPHRLQESLTALKQNFEGKPELVDVPEDRQFIGFDAYKQAMDTLRPGDIVIFASPLAFRWVHYQYAIDKGLHVFMEKPVVADGPTGKKMFELAKKADEKNLKSAGRYDHKQEQTHHGLRLPLHPGFCGESRQKRSSRRTGRGNEARRAAKSRGHGAHCNRAQNAGHCALGQQRWIDSGKDRNAECNGLGEGHQHRCKPAPEITGVKILTHLCAGRSGIHFIGHVQRENMVLPDTLEAFHIYGRLLDHLHAQVHLGRCAGRARIHLKRIT